MPLRKRAYYKRYNVGAEMKRRRLEWEVGEQLLEKEKTLRAKQERLKRLENKVKTAYLVFMPEMVQCYCGFDL